MTLHTRQTGSAEYGRWIKALICGEPGSGKTLISSTFPDAYFASAEGGLMSIADRAIPYADIKTSDDLFELKTMLDLNPDGREQVIGHRVNTVVIDTIDEVQRILIRERLDAERRDKMTLQDFGWLGEKMQTIIRGFRNLEMHVIFTCHLKETKDDELGRIVYKPGLQGQIADQIPGFVDLSLLLTSHLKTVVVDNESRQTIVRALQTFPDSQHPWVKDRSGKLPAEFPVNFKDDFPRLNDLIFKDIASLPQSEALSTPVQVSEPEPAPSADSEPAEIKADPGLKDTITGASAPSGDVCESCSEVVEDEDQAALSRIRLRRVLCKKCYKEAQTAKR